MDLKCSKLDLCVLFIIIKCNFFQKVAFYTHQIDFWAGCCQNVTFWAQKVETNGHIMGLVMNQDWAVEDPFQIVGLLSFSKCIVLKLGSHYVVVFLSRTVFYSMYNC